MRLATTIGLAAAALVAAASCDQVSFPTPPVDEEFTASLAGANEAPPVTTAATGNTSFWVSLDTILSFRIEVGTIDSTTLSHIHEGAAGVPGPVIVTLFVGPNITPTNPCSNAANNDSPRCKTGFTGALANGQFTPSQLTQLPAGYGATPRARFDSLLALMRTGGVYVNVHTRANAGGEVRGQIQPR